MRIQNSKKADLDTILQSVGLDKSEFEFTGENETYNIKYRHNSFLFNIKKYSGDGYELTIKTVDNINPVIYKHSWTTLLNVFKAWAQNISVDIKNEPKINKKEEADFPSLIKRFSKKFIDIYNQAFTAELNGLNEICGLGYRKAFEFLIKDYLLKTNKKSEHQKIKEMQLYSCINTFVTNDEIKLISHRILWLGNDHAHYIRKWKGKDLSDLKQLIDLSIKWIEVHEELLKVKKEMPEGKK